MDKKYYIVLPLSLDGIPIIDGEYDLSFFEKYDTKYIEIDSNDYDLLEIEDLNLELYKKYGFLLEEGEYTFLDFNDCIKLKEYLNNNISSQVKINNFYQKLINFCDEAIKKSTGIAFIY